MNGRSQSRAPDGAACPGRRVPAADGVTPATFVPVSMGGSDTERASRAPCSSHFSAAPVHATDHHARKPAWLRIKAPVPRAYRSTGALLGELELHTVCAEARCPNKGECFAAGTATFLILGDVCTRSCRFCSVRHAAGSWASAAGECDLADVDPDEPRRVAAAAARLGLSHVVVTSVTRDDLPDGGAKHFAATVAAVREALAGATVEVLIPDLDGDLAALRTVLAARPDVLGHNLETVPRLYATVRPDAIFERSLEVLGCAAEWASSGDVRTEAAPSVSARASCAAPSSRAAEAGPGAPRLFVKTGLMVGLGETVAEVEDVLERCAACGVDIVTIGQYLQPHRDRLPVVRYVQPGEFAALEELGARLGLLVVAAPLVRSSYRARGLLERRRGHASLGRVSRRLEGSR